MTFRNPHELRAGDFYVQKMRSAFIKGNRVLTIENATRQEQEIWQEVQLDASFRHAMDTARKMVIGKDWKIEPFDSSKKNRDIAAIYRRLMRKTKNFRRWLFAVSEFFIRGESWGFPNYVSEPVDALNNGRPQEWIFPEEIKHIDRYRIRKITNDDFTLRFEIFSQQQNQWTVLEPERVDALIYFNNSAEEWRFTHGNGLLDTIYWCWYCKKILEGEMLNLAERYGQGMLVAKIESLKLGSKDRKLQTYANEILQLFEYFKARHVGVCGKDEDIQVVEPNGTGYQVLKDLIDYYDNKVLSLCLGANLAVESVQSGSYAQSVVHQDTSYQYIGYDRSIVEEAITNCLFERMWEFNQPQFAALGLADGEPPRFRIVGHRNDSPQANLEILDGALNSLKLPIVKSEAYQMLGLSEGVPPDPENGEEGDELIYPDGMEPKSISKSGSSGSSSSSSQPSESESSAPDTDTSSGPPSPGTESPEIPSPLSERRNGTLLRLHRNAEKIQNN